MEDSSFMELMIDTNEYLIDDWETDFPISEETTDHQNPKQGSDSVSEVMLVSDRPKKQIRQNSNSYSISPSSSSSSSGSLITPQVISFGSGDPKTNVLQTTTTTLNFSNQKVGFKRKDCVLKEHVLAERKRRQKLNERLIALSALLPGLKKADKATVLEDAIKHLKQLQERVKKLEEDRIGTKKMDQSIILIKRSQVYVEDHDSNTSCSASTCSSLDKEVSILKQTMPMIEARVSDKDLLIRIHCENKKGCLVKVLTSLDMFSLEVVNSFALPFGKSTLVITILSKMDNKFSGPIEDVMKNIKLALHE